MELQVGGQGLHQAARYWESWSVLNEPPCRDMLRRGGTAKNTRLWRRASRRVGEPPERRLAGPSSLQVHFELRPLRDGAWEWMTDYNFSVSGLRDLVAPSVSMTGSLVPSRKEPQKIQDTNRQGAAGGLRRASPNERWKAALCSSGGGTQVAPTH